MFPRLTTDSGFTLLELLAVVAIIGLLTGVAIPAFSAFTRRQTLAQATKNLKTDLKAARSQAISGVDGKRWGIHLAQGANNYEIFSTPNFAYDSRTSTQQKDLPSDVTILTLSREYSGQANVVFDRLTGVVSIRKNNGDPLGTEPFSITITLTLSGTNRYVRVDAGGKIYEQ